MDGRIQGGGGGGPKKIVRGPKSPPTLVKGRSLPEFNSVQTGCVLKGENRKVHFSGDFQGG